MLGCRLHRSCTRNTATATCFDTVVPPCENAEQQLLHVLMRSQVGLRKMKCWTAALVSALVLCLVFDTTATCLPGQTMNCKDQGEPCVSRRTSECAGDLVCPVGLGQPSQCQAAYEAWPDCKIPAEHCKLNGEACTPRTISECVPSDICDVSRGVCVTRHRSSGGRRLAQGLMD
jgi:hypothetical protein